MSEWPSTAAITRASTPSSIISSTCATCVSGLLSAYFSVAPKPNCFSSSTMLLPSSIHRCETLVGIARPTVAPFAPPPAPVLVPQDARDRETSAERAAATVVRARMVIVPHSVTGCLRSSKEPHGRARTSASACWRRGRGRRRPRARRPGGVPFSAWSNTPPGPGRRGMARCWGAVHRAGTRNSRARRRPPGHGRRRGCPGAARPPGRGEVVERRTGRSRASAGGAGRADVPHTYVPG